MMFVSRSVGKIRSAEACAEHLSRFFRRNANVLISEHLSGGDGILMDCEDIHECFPETMRRGAMMLPGAVRSTC